MKKALLATGFFFSITLFASAQERKAGVKATPAPAAQKAAPAQLRKKKKVNAATQARIDEKIRIENSGTRPASSSPARETINTPAN